MPLVIPCELAQPVLGLVPGSDDQCLLVHERPGHHFFHSQGRAILIFGDLGIERLGLGLHGDGIPEEVAGQIRLDSSAKHAAAELGEGVVPAVGQDDIVGRLPPAVEAHVEPGSRAGCQGIDERALASIPIAQVNHDVCSVIRHATHPSPCSSS